MAAEQGTASAHEWIALDPKVNAEAEFLEIASDFGNPLELVREAISNSIDAGSSEIRVSFTVEEIDGAAMLVITIEDDGAGMTQEVLSENFWGLGFSTSRHDNTKIGEKGHGTKIFLRSEQVQVKTQGADGAFESVCERAMRALSKRERHNPRLRKIEPFRSGTGTSIRIVGYNNNERAAFVQDVVRDYIYWFTKFGSIEAAFGPSKLSETKLYLKALDRDDFEELSFGHPFPADNFDVDKLLSENIADAADHYVKRYVKRERLENVVHPSRTGQVV